MRKCKQVKWVKLVKWVGDSGISLTCEHRPPSSQAHSSFCHPTAALHDCVLKTQHRQPHNSWEPADSKISPHTSLVSLFSSIPPLQALTPLGKILLLTCPARGRQRSRVGVEFHLGSPLHWGTALQRVLIEVAPPCLCTNHREEKGPSGWRTLLSGQADISRCVDVSTTVLIWSCWLISFSLVNSCCPEPLRVLPRSWAQSSLIF